MLENIVKAVQSRGVLILSRMYQWSLHTNRLHGVGVPKLVLPFVAFLLRGQYWIVKWEKAHWARRRKLKVVFVVSDVTKWKGQTIYDRMLSSLNYDPYVMTTILDKAFFQKKEWVTRYRNSFAYFSRLGLRVLDGYDIEKEKFIPIQTCHPDVVIYQQPWGIDEHQDPIAASAVALTFYLPYYIGAIGDDIYQLCKMPFARLVYAEFSQSEAFAEFLSKQRTSCEFGCRFLAVGCPHFDTYDFKSHAPKQKCVIYAPHWSFKHPKNLSRFYLGTFLLNGLYMLDLASKHPDIKWVFRPHPGLRTKLISTGVMTEVEVDDYFSSWSRVGEVSCEGEYYPLFERSTAMITDCVTFLTEYLLTGNPIIRLVATTCPEPIQPARRLFDAFYDVHSCAELEKVFKDVVIKGEDPMREVRTQVAKDMGCADLHATERVMQCLDKIFHR